MTDNKQATSYQLMGGEVAIKNLVELFYFYMDTVPDAAGIRSMHASNLASAKQKLFKFLSGWLGGPDLYIQEYGHPRLRRRHFPFTIGQEQRDQWLVCMNMALDEMTMEEMLRENIRQALSELATHMINTNG